ncbi:MFS transporter [Herbaspirillum robiniae]|uniref:MFS transporter n=1 Tax=Herbaspirillum robiniae TaxID=2014887 RepID=UPI003D772104
MSDSYVLPGKAVGLDVFEENTYRKVTWRLAPILVIGFLLAYLDRVNISFAKLQMQSDLGLSNAAYGLGASVFFLGYFLFEVPSNLMLNRVGARKWIARIMVSWGLASAAMAFVQSETTFYVLRFILGVAEAGFMPGVILYFTYWFPAKRRARINALFMISVPLSGVIGGPVAGYVLSTFGGIGHLTGWQWLFILEGGVTTIFGFIIFFFLDDGISKAKWLTDDEKTLLNANLQHDPGSSHHRILDALKHPMTLMLSVIYILMLMGFYGMTFWLPQLIRNTGVTSTLVVGLLTAIPYGAAGLGMILAGRSSDRSGERRWHLVVTIAVGAVGYFLSAHFENDTLVAIIALVIASTGVMACLPVFWSIPTVFLSGTAAAAGIAFINSFGNLGGAISPYLVGKVVDVTGSPSQGLMVIAVAMAIASVLSAIVLRKDLSLLSGK